MREMARGAAPSVEPERSCPPRPLRVRPSRREGEVTWAPAMPMTGWPGPKVDRALARLATKIPEEPSCIAYYEHTNTPDLALRCIFRLQLQHSGRTFPKPFPCAANSSAAC